MRKRGVWMEKLSKDVLQKIDELITIIQSSKEYQRYVTIRKQLNNNPTIKTQIQEIKEEQQNLVKNNIKDPNKKKHLQEKINHLKSIPIYNDYLNAIDEMNHYLEPIQYLQDYFDFLTK